VAPPIGRSVAVAALMPHSVPVPSFRRIRTDPAHRWGKVRRA
jgi:hypothetical protein